MNKKGIRTEILLGSVLLLLFVFSFLSFLSMKNKENEYNMEKEAKQMKLQEKKESSVSETKITTETVIKLIDLDTKKVYGTINVEKNSKCLEMTFTEFRQLLKADPRSVLTDSVYQLIPGYDFEQNKISILSFHEQEIILGISCGKDHSLEIKSGFEYFAIVDGSVFTVYHIDCFNDYTTIYFTCKEEDLHLPDDIRGKLEFGLYFEDEAAMYNFLESYSS